MISVAVGLVSILYHRLGSPIDPSGETSTLLWLWYRWLGSHQSTASFYTWFGPLIPVTGLALVWLKRKDLRRTPASVSWMGMMCIVLALFMHWVGVKGEHPRISVMSLVVLLFGSIWYLRGGAVARLLIFPVGFLFFLVPLNFLNGVALRLRVAVADVATIVLGGLGIECQNRGATIFGVGDDPFLLTLQAYPVMFRDLLLLTMAGAVVAYLAQPNSVRRLVLYVLLGPVYLVCLTVVVVMLGLLTQLFGGGVRELVADHVISALVFAILGVITWWLSGLVRRLSVPVRRVGEGGQGADE